ncbi:MAG: glycosyltransferase [Gammaproteobacteria bacterium]|nr:glycosyltransferase [Gammaproteobacteria bacterium]
MLSIAICTYNRARQLQDLLENLSMIDRSWLCERTEILVIDNNSADETNEVTSRFSGQLPLSVFCEPNQGLAHARNRALQEFAGPAILFIDDDVTITQDTLQCYMNALEENPDIGYFGGRISVDWQGQKPTWLMSDDLVLLNGLFGQHDLGNSDLPYDDQPLSPYGANFVLRRSLIRQLGSFNTDLGVKGDSIGRGEETEYFQRARAAGARGQYLAGAEVGHRFQIGRLSIAYLYRYGIEKGRSEVLLAKKVSHAWAADFSGFLVRGVYQLLRGRRDRFYQCVINLGITRGRFMQTKSLPQTEPAINHPGDKK